jgi:hypothetical protein
VNRKGNPATLVAAQPGNQNALRYGVHSERALAARAEEVRTLLIAELGIGREHWVVVHEVARLAAIIDAIDSDLDERGLTDRKGKVRYLVDARARYSRQLERWYEKLPAGLASAAPSRLDGDRSDYVAELQRIALRDRSVSTRDRLRSLQLLLGLGRRGTASGVIADEDARKRRAGGELVGQIFEKSVEGWTASEEDSQ